MAHLKHNVSMVQKLGTLRKKQGVFKKSPNFLNSALCSTDGALQLLSAPSVRLWQQTAICPVLLWSLVVELHPLNWACAQAVRRINDKVTMKELEERVCFVKLFWKLSKNFTETFQLLLIKHTGRNVWAERSSMGGLSALTFWHRNLAFKFEHTLYVKCE
jgi:hypothetical protein